MTMDKVRYAVVVLCLASAAVIHACSEEPAEPIQPQPAATAQPAPTAAPAPVVQRTPASTPSPAEIPAPVSVAPTPAPPPTPVQAPGSSPTATSAPISAPTSTPEPTPTVMDTDKSEMMAELPPECIADGTLDDPVLILICGGEAIQQLESLVVNATIDFSAMFAGLAPPGDDPVPVMEMEFKRVFPDDVDASFTTPDGEEVRMIFLDGAAYVNDPMSNSWAKFSDVTDEMSEMFLTISTFEQQVQEATSGNVEWNEVTLSDDGAKYLVSYKPDVGDQGAMFGPALPEFKVTLDAMSFLYESISLVPPDDDGTGRKIVDIQYSQHNEPLTIEAPSEYTEVPNTEARR